MSTYFARAHKDTISFAFPKVKQSGQIDLLVPSILILKLKIKNCLSEM